MNTYDLIIVGGGPAGLAAAVKARELGIRDILIIERDTSLGGILKQCIHNGFGLHIFKEELTGPEYAKRFIDRVNEFNIQYSLETMVLNIDRDKTVTVSGPAGGLRNLNAKSIILAMGCRERPRGALRIPGTNPSGIFTAGTVQRLVNMEGLLPGTSAVILGSGDIGLIMARRLTLEGIRVRMVCEIMPFPGGLTRNIVQCLEDYNIPLKLSHTVVSIHGRERLEGVTIAKTDQCLCTIPGTEEYVPCDTLLLSVGLIPENELTRGMGADIDEVTGGAYVDQDLETSIEGVFSCGNVLHVHDLVDYVTMEGYRAAENASRYLEGRKAAEKRIVPVLAGNGIRYVLPQSINTGTDEKKIRIYFRSLKKYTDPKVHAAGSMKKFQRLAPAEMEYIDINIDDIKEGNGVEVRVADNE
jgi:thioredoxin reductase